MLLQARTVTSLNPLKSGLCFGQMEITSDHGTSILSQSPQIGAMFRTVVYKGIVIIDVMSQSPQIGAMFRTYRLCKDVKRLVCLNPLKSGLCFGLSYWKAAIWNSSCLNPLKSGLCFGLLTSRSGNMELQRLNPLKSGLCFGHAM